MAKATKGKSKKILSEASYKFLRKYINTPSPTGFESGGQKLWMDYIKPHVDEMFTDAYGSAAGIINPTEKFKVVIEAHADEISWFVNYISPELPEVRMDDNDLSKSIQSLQKEVHELKVAMGK